jgi:DNA-binding MarR family transcriptional regulator
MAACWFTMDTFRRKHWPGESSLVFAMSVRHGPPSPEQMFAAEVDLAAATLVAVWDQARERISTRLSASQLRALLAVEESPGVNLRRLAEALSMILSSASRLCDRLVAAGLIDRESSRSDRREIALSLTPNGVRLLAELRTERRRRLAEVLAGMSEPSRVALLRGLRDFTLIAEPSLTRAAKPA